jgi:hypothetical protein
MKDSVADLLAVAMLESGKEKRRSTARGEEDFRFEEVRKGV